MKRKRADMHEISDDVSDDVSRLRDNNSGNHIMKKQIVKPVRLRPVRHRDSWISASMSAASHILIASFTVFIIYLSCQENILFSWHPACMSLATMLVLTSIMVLSPHHYLASRMQRQGRIRLHYILQGSGFAFMLAGFLTVFFNKVKLGKAHFQTNHGILGLTTLILFALTASGGIIALYSARLSVWVKPALMKFLHNCLGVLAFLFVIATVMVGSSWIKEKTSYSAQIICLITIAMAAILALESSIKSAYGRFNSLFSP